MGDYDIKNAKHFTKCYDPEELHWLTLSWKMFYMKTT